jgi:hypothetical protein
MFISSEKRRQTDSRLDRIESDLRSIDGRISGVDGRLSHLEGMAKLALWVVPIIVGLITAIGTLSTALLRH